MSFTEGSVIIDVDASTPGLTRVRTRSTRGGEIAQAMAGQRIDSPLPLTLISTLYALCPQAHLGAYKSALAAACGQRDDNAGADRRIVYELMGEHLRFLAFDAPNTVGIASDPEVKKLGALRALLSREFSKPDPDFEALDIELEPLIEYFVTGCPIERFHALNSLPDFEAWMLRGKTAAARLYAQLWENVPCRRQTRKSSTPGIDGNQRYRELITIPSTIRYSKNNIPAGIRSIQPISQGTSLQIIPPYIHILIQINPDIGTPGHTSPRQAELQVKLMSLDRRYLPRIRAQAPSTLSNRSFRNDNPLTLTVHARHHVNLPPHRLEVRSLEKPFRHIAVTEP